jgi:hypothetical protein
VISSANRQGVGEVLPRFGPPFEVTTYSCMSDLYKGALMAMVVLVREI